MFLLVSVSQVLTANADRAAASSSLATTTSPTPTATTTSTPTPSPDPGSLADQFARDPGQAFLDYVVGVPLRVAIIIVCAVVFWALTVRAVNRVTRRLVVKAESDRLALQRQTRHTSDLAAAVMNQRRRARAEAIAALLRSAITFVIATITILLVLAQFEIDLTPLLASAGIVGVALSFGAQSLVKDYLSGIFIILEDQYGVGDLVDVGEAIGHVEDVTLRVTRLRDLTGIVWYVRNGEILRVANKSQGWTIAIVDIPVMYDEDLGRVRDVVERVADDMDADATFDGKLLGRLAYGGVESVSGEAVYVRMTAKVKPEEQVPTTRAIRERVKAAFDAAGIQVPVLLYGAGGTGPGGAGRPGAATPPS